MFNNDELKYITKVLKEIKTLHLFMLIETPKIHYDISAKIYIGEISNTITNFSNGELKYILNNLNTPYIFEGDIKESIVKKILFELWK